MEFILFVLYVHINKERRRLKTLSNAIDQYFAVKRKYGRNQLIEDNKSVS